MRTLLALMALFVVLAFSTLALDSDMLVIEEIEVNGNDLQVGSDGEVLSVDEGETMDVKVVLENNGTTEIEDLEVEARISGFEFEDLEASTEMFDVRAGTKKAVHLELELPRELESDEYWLRVRVMDKNTQALEQVVRLSVEPQRHALAIADVAFSPGSTVRAGRSLLATVLLENFGEKDEKDVKVTVSIPELGVSATEFVDVVETDDENFDFEDVPEMFLPIPATAEEGDYEVTVTAQYHDLRKTVTETRTVQVLADERFQEPTGDQLVTAVGPETQSVPAGSTATYGVVLTNAGRRSTAYVLEVATGGWATARVSETLVVLEPGKNKVVYVDVTPAKDATAGEHVASVVVKSSDGEVLQSIPLKATVTARQAAQTTSLRSGLEIALVVLVVLLVIVGVFFGFSRMRKDEGEGQTYY